MLFYKHALASGDVPAEWRKTLLTMILETMHAKTVTFVLLFLLVFSVFFAYIFFFHTLFSAEWHAGPLKKYYGSENGFYIGPSPDMHSPRKKSKNQSHCPGSRLGMVESGSGSVRSWPRGGRAPSPLVAPSVGMESSDDAKACMPAWVKMANNREMRGVT